MLVECAGILAKNLFDVRDPSHGGQIESVASAQGFDVIITTGGPKSVRTRWQNLARGGRLVTIGDGSDMPDLGTLDASIFSRGATLCHMDMLEMIGREPKRASRWVNPGPSNEM